MGSGSVANRLAKLEAVALRARSAKTSEAELRRRLYAALAALLRYLKQANGSYRPGKGTFTKTEFEAVRSCLFTPMEAMTLDDPRLMMALAAEKRVPPRLLANVYAAWAAYEHRSAACRSVVCMRTWPRFLPLGRVVVLANMKRERAAEGRWDPCEPAPERALCKGHPIFG